MTSLALLFISPIVSMLLVNQNQGNSLLSALLERKWPAQSIITPGPPVVKRVSALHQGKGIVCL